MAYMQRPPEGGKPGDRFSLRMGVWSEDKVPRKTIDDRHIEGGS